MWVPAEPGGVCMRGSPLHQRRPCASPARRHCPAACEAPRLDSSAPGPRHTPGPLAELLNPQLHVRAGCGSGRPGGHCGRGAAHTSGLNPPDGCSSGRPGGGCGAAEGAQPKASWGAGGGAKRRVGPEASAARRVPLVALARRTGCRACAAPDLVPASSGRACPDLRCVTCCEHPAIARTAVPPCAVYDRPSSSPPAAMPPVGTRECPYCGGSGFLGFP